MKILALILSSVILSVSCKKSTNDSSDTTGCNFTNSITIGSQEWTSKNLDVSEFNNGDEIPYAGSANWNGTLPGWCYCNNDSLNGVVYGKLYNWHAINDPRGISPNGWHVPTNDEWTLMEDYLSDNGHQGYEGTVLKSSEEWNGTNNYCFNALPGGFSMFFENSDGSWDNGPISCNSGSAALFWTSIEDVNNTSGIHGEAYCWRLYDPISMLNDDEISKSTFG